MSGVTGNFVGETLTIISANQADVRIDWNLSADNKIFGRYSFAEYEQRTDKRAIPLLLGSLRTPFRNLALNWNRIISPTLVNEVLFGYNQITVVGDTLDWGGIGDANATFGSPAVSRLPDELDRVGQRPDGDVGADATDTNTLDKTYQINEKLTWLKGRHTVKGGGQFCITCSNGFTLATTGCSASLATAARQRSPFADFLLDQVWGKGRGSQSEAWTHLHNRLALFVQDDFKVTSALTLNLGMRWAYTQPIVEKDNLQSNGEHRSAGPRRGR